MNDAGARVMAASLGERVHRASAPTSDRIDADWIEDLGRLSGMAKDRLETLRVSFAQLDQPVVTVRLPGRAVGLLVEDHPWAGIFDVAVHPSYRRQGLGSAVVDTLLATATGHGVSHIYLQVHPSNHGAVSLYERRSFTEVYAYTYRSLR